MGILFFAAAAAVIGVTAAVFFVSSRRAKRVLAVCEIALLLAGVLAAVLAVVLARRISGSGADAETVGWARDMLSVWITMAAVFAGVAGGAVLLAALIRHPMRRTRLLVAGAGALLVLLGGGAYAGICAADSVPLVPAVYAVTFAAALILRAGCLIDRIFDAKAVKSAKKDAIGVISAGKRRSMK